MRWITGWGGPPTVSALHPGPAPCNKTGYRWPSIPRTPEMLDTSTVVKKSANQVSCVLNEEVAVLNLDRALYFGLNGVAAHIWDDVMAQFDVASEVCRADVSSFVISMRDAGLVEIVG